MASENKIDLIKLGLMGPPLKIILQHLALPDKIILASTNKQLKQLCFIECRDLRHLDQLQKLDLQIFTEPITQDIVNAINRVFPNLTKIVARLSKVENGFLDFIRIFSKLNKLTVYLSVDDSISNRHGINLQQVTIKAEFYNFKTRDVIYSLLWQIRGTKRLSIYNGQLDRRLIYLLSTRNLEVLKLQNCMVTNPIQLTNVILEFTQMKYLKLTTNNYLIAPATSNIMSHIIKHLITHRNLQIERLTFTLDTSPLISYSNLRFLKQLKHLTIYYTVQNNGVSLEKLIYYAASLRWINVTFVEFVEKYRIFNESVLQATERKSYYYKNIIESMDNFINVITIDYDQFRRQTNLRN